MKANMATVIYRPPLHQGEGSSVPRPDKERKTFDPTHISSNELKDRLEELGRRGFFTSPEQTQGFIGLIQTPLTEVIYDGKTDESADIPQNFVQLLERIIAGDRSRNDAANETSHQTALDLLKSIS